MLATDSALLAEQGSGTNFKEPGEHFLYICVSLFCMSGVLELGCFAVTVMNDNI